MSDNTSTEELTQFFIDEFTVGPRIVKYQMDYGLVNWRLGKFFHRLTFSAPKGTTLTLPDSEIDQFRCLWQLCTLYNEQTEWLNERNISEVVIGYIPGLEYDRCPWKSGYHAMFLNAEFDVNNSEYRNSDSFIIHLESENLDNVLEKLFPVNDQIVHPEPAFTEEDFPAINNASNTEATVTKAAKATPNSTSNRRPKSWAEDSDSEDEDEAKVQPPPISGGGKAENISKKVEVRPETPMTVSTDAETADIWTPKEANLVSQLAKLSLRQISVLKTNMFEYSKTDKETIQRNISRLLTGIQEALVEE